METIKTLIYSDPDKEIIKCCSQKYLRIEIIYCYKIFFLVIDIIRFIYKNPV